MRFADLAAQDQALTTVSPALAADLAMIHDDIMIIGAGGKLGPSLVQLACRGRAETGTSGSVFAVSRFGDSSQSARLEAGQLSEIDRIWATYPDLRDDDFINQHRDRLLDRESLNRSIGAREGARMPAVPASPARSTRGSGDGGR